MFRAQGNSGGYKLGILRSSPGTSSKTFIFLGLPEIPGSHLFLVNGQDFKKSKTGGVPGVQWTQSCGQGTEGEGDIFRTADLPFLYTSLFCNAIFV